MTWDGRDRRETPHSYDMMERIKAELDARDKAIQTRLDAIAKTQESIDRKLMQWETGAIIIRWLAISTAGLVASGIAVAEWLRDHLK